MRIIKDDTIAVLIDVQEKLFPHMHEKEELEKNLIRLLSGLIILGVPVLFTEQYTKGLGFTIPSLKEVPGINAAIEKQAFSCCDEPAFSTELKSYDRKNVILCGIETHVCVLQTSLDLLGSGYQPIVIEDCVSSRKIQDKNTAIKRMRQEGALISGLESVLFELVRVSGTEEFKAISRLIK